MKFTFRVKKPLSKGEFEIEKIDKDFILEQISIALRAYEKEGFPHKGPLENLLGLAAELSFKEFLTELGLIENKDYQWNERKVDFWDNDPRPWDFKLKNGITFEIGAARPFHRYAVFNLSKHKKESDYFVQVQIKWLVCTGKVYHNGKERWYRFDAKDRTGKLKEITNREEINNLESIEESVIGESVIKIFDKIKIIQREENGWEFSPAGSVITPDDDGMVKLINNQPNATAGLIALISQQSQSGTLWIE